MRVWINWSQPTHVRGYMRGVRIGDNKRVNAALGLSPPLCYDDSDSDDRNNNDKSSVLAEMAAHCCTRRIFAFEWRCLSLMHSFSENVWEYHHKSLPKTIDSMGYRFVAGSMGQNETFQMWTSPFWKWCQTSFPSRLRRNAARATCCEAAFPRNGGCIEGDDPQ